MIALLISCAASLGPSYTVEKQNWAVHFVAEPPAHLEIEANFHLIASGTQPLEAIEIKLPDDKTFPTQHLRISLDGRNVSLKPPPHLSNHSVRIQFDSPWQPKQRQSLMVQYTLPALSPKGATDSPAGFVVGGDWYPILLSRKGMFAKLLVNFNKWDLEIRVPEGFLVHAGGRVRGSRKDNGETVLRVQQQTDDIPFIVAGRYKQQIVSTTTTHQKTQIVFWTSNPVSADAAHEASMQIARLKASYGHMFGTLSKSRSKDLNTIWIVECLSSGPPASSENSTANEVTEALCTTSLPDTILLTSQVSSNGVASDAMQEEIDLGLARLWLGHAGTPSDTQDDWPLSGLHAYAVHAVRREEPYRPRQPAPPERKEAILRHNVIARYLAEYDKKLEPRAGRPDQQDKFIRSTGEKVKPFREPSFEKSVLFFFALEDQYGPEGLHRAIARMVYARGEQGYNRNDLRAALEGEIKKSAADFFRSWLDQPGLPKDFRARYEYKSNPSQEAQ